MLTGSEPSGLLPSLTTVRPGRDVSWAIASHGIRLIRRNGLEQIFLFYPEAALWDFLVRRLPDAVARRALAVVLECPEEEAGRFMERALSRWINQGWLILGERDG
jgi:hypothetical protein